MSVRDGANTDETINKKTNKSLAWFTSVPLVVHLLRFGSSLVLARILSPSDFGVMGLVTVIMYYTDTFTDFGFAKALVQKKRLHKNHYRSYFLFNAILSVFLFVILQLASSTLEDFFEIDELASAVQVYSFLILITAVSSPARIKLRREINFKVLAISEALLVGVSIPTSITLAINDFGFWAMIYGSLLGQCIALIFVCFMSKTLLLPSTHLHLLKPLLQFSKWDFLAGQAKLIADNADKIIIGKVLGVSAVGLYDRALGLAQMPYGQTSGKIGNVAFSTFSRFQGAHDDLLKSFKQITTINILMIAPLLMGMAAISDTFVYTVLGQKWEEMITALQIFCISFMFAGLAAPNLSFNTAIGKISLQTKINIFLMVNLLVSITFVAEYGVNFVALSLMIYQALVWLSSCYIVVKYSNITLSVILRSIVYPLASTVVMLLFVIYLKIHVFTENTVFDLVSLISAGGAVFLMTIYLLPVAEFSFFRKWLSRNIKN